MAKSFLKKFIDNKNKQVKNLDVWDIALTKLTVFAAALWLVGFFPGFRAWVQWVPHWVFLGVFVLALIRPMKKFFKK